MLETSSSTPRVMPWASARAAAFAVLDQIAEGIRGDRLSGCRRHMSAAARAGAQRHHRAIEPCRDFNDAFQSLESLIAQPPIGMDHVVGARQRGEVEAARGKTAADPINRRVVDPAGRVSPTTRARSNCTSLALDGSMASRFSASVAEVSPCWPRGLNSALAIPQPSDGEEFAGENAEGESADEQDQVDRQPARYRRENVGDDHGEKKQETAVNEQEGRPPLRDELAREQANDADRQEGDEHAEHDEWKSLS